MPEPAGNAPGLQRHKSLEIEERRQQRGGRRIVIDDTLQIQAGGFDEIGSSRICLRRHAREQRVVLHGDAKPLPDLPVKVSVTPKGG